MKELLSSHLYYNNTENCMFIVNHYIIPHVDDYDPFPRIENLSQFELEKEDSIIKFHPLHEPILDTILDECEYMGEL